MPRRQCQLVPVLKLQSLEDELFYLATVGREDTKYKVLSQKSVNKL